MIVAFVFTVRAVLAVFPPTYPARRFACATACGARLHLGIIRPGSPELFAKGVAFLVVDKDNNDDISNEFLNIAKEVIKRKKEFDPSIKPMVLEGGPGQE